MKSSYTKHLLWIIAVIFAASCAQVVPPSGGAIDRLPPRVVKYVPDSAPLHFKGKEIAITFNEYIQLRDAQTQVVVSPPLPTAPVLRIKNKTLYIRLEDSLRSSTTYSINFGTAIRDITEGNTLNNFQYVFSTGSYIDSLSVTGRITDAFKLNNPKDVLVLLYDDLSDSIPYKKMPSYFSKTDDRGMYRINNMKPGTYKAFALKDANANYIYDQPGELIGFLEEPFTVDKQNDTLNMMIFEEEGAKNSIRKTSTLQYGKLLLVLSKGAEKLELQPIDAKMKTPPIIEYSEKRDSIMFWYNDIDQESISMRVVHNDKVLDTVRYTLIKRNASRGTKDRFELAMRTNVSKSQPFDLKQDVQLVFNHPIAKHDPSRIILTKGQDTLKYGSAFIDSVHRQFRISYSFEGDSAYKLTLLKGAFEDMFGLTTDTMQVEFKMRSPKYYGTAKIKTDLPGGGNYIFQLLNDKDAVVEETKAKGPVTLDYPLLKPGNYRLKVIYDANGNDKWDTGDYMKKIQPEEVKFYPGTISIRSNWDLDLEWKLSSK